MENRCGSELVNGGKEDLGESNAVGKLYMRTQSMNNG